MIFSGEFELSQLSVANCVVNVIQYDIISWSTYVPYNLSLAMVQNSCFKVILIFPGSKKLQFVAIFWPSLFFFDIFG